MKLTTFELTLHELSMWERNKAAQQAMKLKDQRAFADLFAKLKSNSLIFVRSVATRLDLTGDWLKNYRVTKAGNAVKQGKGPGPGRFRLTSEEFGFYRTGKAIADDIKRQSTILHEAPRKQLAEWTEELRQSVVGRLELPDNWMSHYTIDESGRCKLNRS